MTQYTKSTNFATKDNLTPGDPLKVVRGTEIDTEYNNIATAIATKTDNASSAITGGAIDGATVGATTPATGSFTTLAASGTTTLAGALVGAATQAAFNTVSTTLNLGGAATAVNLGAATGTATVNNTTLAAKAITASTTLAVTGTSTLTGAVTATAGVTGPITSSSVSITGGSITGITDLAVADGGTGASTAATALNNLLPSQTSNANKYLQTDGTNATWDAVSLSTADITGTLGVANGGTGVTSSTGTVAVVLSNSPTLVTPALGTPSSAVLTNATGLPISTGVSGLGTGVATLLATPSSANLASAITDETGSGSLVFATSPTLVTPILGTPTSATLTNATGLPIGTGVSGLGTGVATFLATPSSANLRSALTDETGTGSAVFATSPTLVTPALGTPSSGVVTNLTGTASININGTVGATTASTGAFTTLGATGDTNLVTTTVIGGAGTAAGLTALTVGDATNATFRMAFTNGPLIQFAKNSTVAFAFGSKESSSGTFTEQMRLSAAGDVGIGTSSPTSLLSVGTLGTTAAPAITIGSATNGTGSLYFGDGVSSATYRGYVEYSHSTDSLAIGTAGTERLVVNSSGNVGIGGAVTNDGGYARCLQVTGTEAVLELKAGSDFSYLAQNGSTLQIRNNAASGVMTFSTVSTERARFNATGALVFAGGTTTADGIGITFPATQSASSDANTLDDYEEGTWTPAVTFGGGATGVTFGVSNGGTYTKVGRIVTVCGILDLTSKGSSTGNISITGLPFSGSNFGGAALTLYGLTFTGQAYGQPNGAAMVLFQILAGTRTVLTDTAFANDTSIGIQITYYV